MASIAEQSDRVAAANDQAANDQAGTGSRGRIARFTSVGALILFSGPSSLPPVSQAELDALSVAPNAPVQTLGTSGTADLTIQAADLAPGRYKFDGDLTIAGNLTQPYVEIEAANIHATGSIDADHVRLIASEGPSNWQQPRSMPLADGRTYLDGFDSVIPRGDISVAGSVQGDNITMVAGTIEIAGGAMGDIDLQASQGEVAAMRIADGLGLNYVTYPGDQDVPRIMRSYDLPAEMVAAQSIPDTDVTEMGRWPIQSAEVSISIGGITGDEVVMRTPRDAALEPAEPSILGQAIAAVANRLPGFDGIPVRAVGGP